MLNVSEPTNSGTTRFFTVNLKDQYGIAGAPLQAFTTVYNDTTGEVIRAEASITAGATLSFKTTDEENTIMDPDLSSEKRRIVLRCTFGVGDAIEDFATYKVQRVTPAAA